MLIRTTKLAALVLLVGVIALAALGQSPASAGLVPGVLGNPPSIALDSSVAVTSTVTVTPTATMTPTATSVKVANTPTVTPTSALPTATKTVTPTVAAATATKTVTPTVATATATKTVTPTVATATATKSATPVARLGPRASAIPSSLSTGFMVQNLDPVTTATVTAVFYNSSGGIIATESKSAGPNQFTSFDQRSDPGIPSPFVGSVVLNSNTQVAALVNEVSGSSATLGTDFRAGSYIGTPGTGNGAAATSALLPQLLKNLAAGGVIYNSSIAIQNTDLAVSANVYITYYTMFVTPVPAPVQHLNITIPAGSSYVQYMNLETNLAASWFGAAVVTSDKPVAVVVNHNAVGQLTVYQGFTPPSANVKQYAPQVMKNFAASGYVWNTGIVAMMADPTQTADVWVTYTIPQPSPNPPLVITSHKTASLGTPSVTFSQSTDTDLNGQTSMFASAVVTSTSPIVAMVNIVSNVSPVRGAQAVTYRTIPDGSGTAKVFFPELLLNVYDPSSAVNWSTGISGQLIGGSNTTVTLTYYYTDGTGSHTVTSTRNVTTASPAFSFNQQNDPALGAAYNGKFFSGVLTTNPVQPIAAIANITGDALSLGDAATNYAGINQ